MVDAGEFGRFPTISLFRPWINILHKKRLFFLFIFFTIDQL